MATKKLTITQICSDATCLHESHSASEADIDGQVLSPAEWQALDDSNEAARQISANFMGRSDLEVGETISGEIET